MGKSSKVACSVVCNSCAPLSDIEVTIVDSDDDDDESSHSGSKAGSPNHQTPQSSKPSKALKAMKLKTSSRKVSEPMHMGVKGFKEETRNSLSALDQLVELKANAEEIEDQMDELTAGTQGSST
jgi:hypothetical protein